MKATEATNRNFGAPRSSSASTAIIRQLITPFREIKVECTLLRDDGSSPRSSASACSTTTRAAR